MGTLLDAFKTLKLWQIGTLAAVLIGVAAATYGVYALVGSSGSTELAKDQQLIPVAYGNLVNQVSTNGSLVFANRATLTFGTQGTVGEVLVAEGQQVKEGQTLATLDAATVTSLQKAAAQARVNLKNARDTLATVKAPLTSLALAQAEAKVANARLSLKTAQDALDTARAGPTSGDLAQAEAKVTNAKLSLKAAQDALDTLMAGPTAAELAQAEAKVANAKLSLKTARDALDAAKAGPTAGDLAQAEAKVANAKLSLKTAQDALDTLMSGPTASDLAKAQARVDSAEASLANSERDLMLGRKDWDAKVKADGDTLATAKGDYQRIFSKWLGVQIGSDQVEMAPDTVLASWRIDLNALFDTSLRFGDFNKGLLAGELPSDDTSTPWNEPLVYTWLNLYPGLLQATCPNGIGAAQGTCVKKEMDDAWDTYQTAKDDSEAVQTQASKAIVNLQNGVNLANDAITTAEDALAELKAGPDPLEVDAKAKQLALSQATLEQAQVDLAELKAGPDPLQVDAKAKQLALSQATLEQAQVDLAEMKAGPDPLQVDATEKQLATAQATLQQAQVDLANLKAGISLDVANKEADVAAAQTALDTATQRLDAATLKSPMAGVVSLVNVEAGQMVNANATIMEVVDSKVVELNGVVDQTDVLFVNVGSQANVTMDALSGQVLQGTVSSISSTAQTQSGVVSYPITITLSVPQGLQLREGLSATASIVIREENNVLLVPLQALYGTFDQPTVKVSKNGSIVDQPVVLGSSDDYWVAVRQGLAQGDQVVMQSATTTAGQFNVGQAMRQFQGQFGQGAMPGGSFTMGGGDRQQARPTPRATPRAGR